GVGALFRWRVRPPSSGAGAELYRFRLVEPVPIPLRDLDRRFWREGDALGDRVDDSLRKPGVFTAQHLLCEPVRGVVGVLEQPREEVVDTQPGLSAEHVGETNGLLTLRQFAHRLGAD